MNSVVYVFKPASWLLVCPLVISHCITVEEGCNNYELIVTALTLPTIVPYKKYNLYPAFDLPENIGSELCVNRELDYVTKSEK